MLVQQARWAAAFGPLVQRQPNGDDDLAAQWEDTAVPVNAPASSAAGAGEVAGKVADTTALTTELANVGVGGPQDTMDVGPAAAGEAQDTTNVTSGDVVGGPLLAGLGLVTSAVGAGVAAGRLHEVRAAMAGLTPEQRAGVQGHVAARELGGAGGDVGEKAAGTVAGGLGLAAASVLTAATRAGPDAGALLHAAPAIGAAAGAVATPLSLFQAGRLARKAYKAEKRADALRRLLAAQPPPNLAGLHQNLDEQFEATTLALDAHRQRGDESAAAAAAQKLEGLRQERAQLEPVHSAMVGELQASSARDEEAEPSLVEIQAYALKKNERGVIKKLIGAYAALVGAAGGVAAMVAAIALAAGAASGAAVLMATPVGWALAGCAAAIGLGLFTYSVIKSLRKRFKATRGQGLSTSRRIGLALAFWRKLGPSKRERFAAKLVDYATGADAALRAQAKETMRALGLRENDLPPEPPAPLAAADRKPMEQLVAAKMAS
jgi:hypothetical protein